MNRSIAVAALALAVSACSPSITLPTCAAGEGVTSDGTTLKCQKLPATTIPTCSAGLFLTAQNGELACALPAAGADGGSVIVPTCNAGQVLTGAAGALSCVNTVTVPSCTSGQILTTSGGALSCVNPAGGLTVPNCTGGQVATGNGTAFSCVTPVTVPTCTGGQVLTGNGTAFSCISPITIPTCGSSDVVTANGTAFTCKAPLTLPTCTAGQMVFSNGTALSCVTAPSGTKVYKGNTAGMTNGDINSGGLRGLTAAAALCAASYGAGARMCTVNEMFDSVSNGTIANTATVARAWVYSAAGRNDRISSSQRETGSSQADNCASFTYGTGDTLQYGTSVEFQTNPAGVKTLKYFAGPAVASSSQPSVNCSTQLPIACCN
jgi:hypothetical protein